MRVVASSSICHEKTQSTQACCFQTVDVLLLHFWSFRTIWFNNVVETESVSRPRIRGVRDVACSLSLMNRLNQKYYVFKIWMLYFQRITFSDYFVRNCDMHQRCKKVKFFHNKLFLQLFWDNQKIIII